MLSGHYTDITMADEASKAVDMFKLAGLILGGWGATLSTYNFFESHFTRLLIEFIPDRSQQTAGRVRILCLGRPRFVDEMTTIDASGKIIASDNVGKTLARGESHRKSYAKNSLAKGTVYEIQILSERNTYRKKFSIG